MTPKRIYLAMFGVNILLILLVIASVFLGDSLLKKQSDTIIATKLESAVLDKQQIALLQDKRDLAKYSDLKSIAKQIVPQEKDQALTTREIVSLANKAGIKIGSIGFPSSTLGNIAAKQTTEASPGTAAKTSSGISQAKPVTGISDLLALDIVVSSDNTKPSSYNQVIAFLASLENNRRTAQVSQISILPDGKDPSLLNFNLTLTVYIKP
jgi:hypothetical protein